MIEPKIGHIVNKYIYIQFVLIIVLMRIIIVINFWDKAQIDLIEFHVNFVYKVNFLPSMQLIPLCYE